MKTACRDPLEWMHRPHPGTGGAPKKKRPARAGVAGPGAGPATRRRTKQCAARTRHNHSQRKRPAAPAGFRRQQARRERNAATEHHQRSSARIADHTSPGTYIITAGEGQRASVTLRLSAAPSEGKTLLLITNHEGSSEIGYQAQKKQGYEITADNWNQPIVIWFEAERDDNDVDEQAVVTFMVVTDLLPLEPGQDRRNRPAERYDAKWHAVSSKGLSVTFADSGN